MATPKHFAHVSRTRVLRSLLQIVRMDDEVLRLQPLVSAMLAFPGTVLRPQLLIGLRRQYEQVLALRVMEHV